MSEKLSSGAPKPFYFEVPEPSHFRLRTDLIEELCIPDAFALTLPRTPEAHARWVSSWGHSAEDLPFHAIRLFLESRYQPTARYLLHPAILREAASVQNILTDGRGWSVRCERYGLYDFVINRAVEYAVSRGYEEGRARALFFPKPGGKEKQGRRHGEWSIGYECVTGLCTILARIRDQTESRYLAGQPGYFVPTFK
jgi:hypothetical protein